MVALKRQNQFGLLCRRSLSGDMIGGIFQCYLYNDVERHYDRKILPANRKIPNFVREVVCPSLKPASCTNFCEVLYGEFKHLAAFLNMAKLLAIVFKGLQN